MWVRDGQLGKLTYDGKYPAAKIMRWRNQGLGYKRIAKKLGTTRDTARELVQRLERLQRERKRRARLKRDRVGRR
jgi:hypothetical protein